MELLLLFIIINNYYYLLFSLVKFMEPIHKWLVVLRVTVCICSVIYE